MTPNNKRVNEEIEGEKGDIGHANWSRETLHIFYDLCIHFAEKSKGKRGATVSQKMSWKLLESEFSKKNKFGICKE
ncbi:hypothetical protein M5689_000808 [Euphorbia peplus]|nr:hypothetical protein M5689_000808 [Euphorbia peplus]